MVQVLLFLIGLSFMVLILGSALAYHLNNPADAYYDYEGPCEDGDCAYDDNEVCLDCGWSAEEARAFDNAGTDVI